MSTSGHPLRMTLPLLPNLADASVLALCVGDKGAYGMLEPGDFDLGAVYPLLSPGGRAWFMGCTPDTVLRGALNCWWAAGATPTEREVRRVQAEGWYYSNGRALRARVIARQDAERARA